MARLTTRLLAALWVLTLLASLVAALRAEGKDVTVALTDGGRVCWDVAGVPTCVPVAVLARTFEGFKDGALSALERAQVAERVADNQVMAARAARADCEAMLGPLEGQARRAAQERAIATLRRQYESDHPGWTLDDNGQPVKKGKE